MLLILWSWGYAQAANICHMGSWCSGSMRPQPTLPQGRQCVSSPICWGDLYGHFHPNSVGLPLQVACTCWYVWYVLPSQQGLIWHGAHFWGLWWIICLASFSWLPCLGPHWSFISWDGAYDLCSFGGRIYIYLSRAMLEHNILYNNNNDDNNILYNII